MKDNVYYLVLSDKRQNPGLIFPSETTYDDFKIGQWFVIDDESGMRDTYYFDCVSNGILTTYPLQRKRNNIYQLKTKDGSTYFFRIERRRYWSDRYVGSSRIFSPGDRLWVVVPTSTDTLSDSAREKKFYFVGRVDQQIENKG